MGYPFFLMATDQFAWFLGAEGGTQLWVMAEGKGQEIRLAAKLGSFFSNDFPQKGDLVLPDDAARLSVHASSSAARSVFSKAALDSWNEILITSFGFAKTRPAIFQSLLGGESFFIHLDDIGVAIGLTDTSQAFISSAQKWLEEEERRHRLVTRAFRLPDGTIGFEQVAGEPASILSLDPSLPQCFGPQGADLGALKDSWLCRNGSHVILASNREMLEIALSVFPSEFSLVAGSTWLQKLGAPQLSAFSGIFNENTLQARLLFSS
jgi:hypothetical protein